MTLEQALQVAGWPHTLLHESKQPWIVDDVRVRSFCLRSHTL